MIDNIRENRRKFSELIHIYEGRITKLEEKISRVKQQGVSMSAKSNRKWTQWLDLPWYFYNAEII